MKKITLALAILTSLGLFTGCVETATTAAEDEERGLVEQNTDGSSDGNTDGNTDGSADGSSDGNADGNSDGSTTGGSADINDLCEQMCERNAECMDAVCTQSVIDVPSCTNACAADPNSTEAALELVINSACGDLVAINCTQASIQQVCTCPENDCPEGLYCLPLASDGINTINLCGNSDGSIPAGAPTCDAENQCESTHMCIVASQGATSGSCLQTCGE